MPRRCKVCGASKESVHDLILFKAPDTPKRRTEWSEACGIPVTKSTIICQHHFLPSDILGSENRMRLKLTALPTAFLYCEPESSLANVPSEKETSKSEQNMIQTEIKTEPPETYLPVNELNIKEESKDAYEPMILIHEAHFDAHNPNPRALSVEKENPAENETYPEHNSIKQRKVCGRIEYETKRDTNILILICNLCDKEFEISKYVSFGEHMNEHQDDTKTTTNDNLQTTVVSDKCDKDLSTTDNAGQTDANNEDLEDDVCASEQSENDSSDEAYEPKTKLIKKEKRRYTKSKEDNLISFRTPNKQCVIDFLDLVKTNAILWHRRISIKKRFDETMAAVILIFNTKWPDHKMTEEQSYLSITRIKDLYKRVTDTSHKRYIKNSTLEKKYPEYFKLCSEIEENSNSCIKSCDCCSAFFFSEVDLQVHKVKTHRIGELPFKCKICKYGFSKAEKLAEHEQKHNRTRTFTCEICNRGFYTEKHFKLHSAIHDKRICDICGKVFSSQANFRLHKIYHEAPQKKCKICGKLFYIKYDLSEHMKSHRNERHYECDICGKSFNQQRGLGIHKRGVHNIKSKSQNTSQGVWVSNSSLSSDTDANEDVAKSSNLFTSNTYANDIAIVARNQRYLGELFLGLENRTQTPD